jgi:DNA-binding GntR family transcriptional regulator
MSRTPVREALDRLGRLGYLEPIDGGGYQRRRYRTRDIRDLYELRLLLEPVGAGLAAANRRRAPDPDDRAFHAEVARASGNRVLARVVELLAERMSTIRTEVAQDGSRQTRTSAEREDRVAHAAVAGAIARRDEVAARRAMKEHLTFEARGLLRGGPTDGPVRPKGSDT